MHISFGHYKKIFIFLIVASLTRQSLVHGMNPGAGIYMTMASQQVLFGLRNFAIADMMKQYNLIIPAFIEHSQKHTSLDWALFQAIQRNDLNITLDSYINNMGSWATKTTSTVPQSSITSCIYHPLLFSREQSRQVSFSMPLVDTSYELSSMYGNRVSSYASAPIFNYESNVGSGRFQFSVNLTPVNRQSRAAYYHRIYEAQRNAQRQAIIHNSDLSQQYFEAVHANAGLLRAMILGESEAERIKAQLSVNQLELVNLFKEGEILQIVKSRIQHFLLQQDHLHPAFTLEERGKLLEIIAPFFEQTGKSLKDANFYTDFLNDCIKQNIPESQLLMDRHKGENSLGDKISNFFGWLIPEHALNSLSEDLKENTFIKDYQQLEQHCKSQKFMASQSIIDKYLNRLKSARDAEAIGINNEFHALRVTHSHYYQQIFNEHGIKYEHTDDPYYVVAKQLLITCPFEHKQELLETIQKTINLRQEKLAALFSTLKTDGKNPIVRAYAYRLIDAQSPQEIVKILGSLASDHSETDYRLAYDVFIEGCVPKWLTNNSKRVMADDLSTQANTQARVLYGLCNYFEVKTKEQQAQLDRIIDYISQSCSQEQQSKDFMHLAEKLYHSMAHGDKEVVERCPDLSVVFNQPEQINLKNTLLSLAVNCLKKIEEIKAGAEGDYGDMLAVLADINKAFTCIRGQDLAKANAWIEKVIEPAIREGSLSKQIKYSRNSLLVSELMSKCSILNDEIPLPQCFIPDNKEWIYGDEFIFDETDLPYFDASLPGLIAAEKLFEWLGHSPDNPDLENVPQCNWGKQQQLPSFGESEKQVDNSKRQQNEPNQEIVVQEKQENSKKATSAEEPGQKNAEAELEKVKIEISKELIEELIDKYGEEYVAKILKESIQVFPPTDYNQKKYLNYSEKFERLVQDLAKIRSNMRWSKFTNDPADKNKTTLKTVEEAIAGIACEEQNIFQHLERSENEAEEFIELLEDGTLQAWDVKTFRMHTPDESRYIFDETSYSNKIKKELLGRENVIVNIIHLPEAEANKLLIKIKDSFETKDLNRIVFVDPRNANRSKQFNEFLKK